MPSITCYDGVLQMTAADRCDRCGAAAYVLAIFDNGSELLFCAHHSRRYHQGLAAVATLVVNSSLDLPAMTLNAA